ncbi:hypothetical protein FS837_004260 [Tulasnella sp. UAMH 9824]|nr:hypothetical protein FS837_004260 [Tulasnella sp. UAMH 9824]
MPINIAIAGATGHPATSSSARDLEARGAEVIHGEPTVDHLEDIDVFINVLSDKVSTEVRDVYVQAAVQAGVKVYFPNEFVATRAPNSSDARVLDFEHPLYQMKVAHAKKARELGSGKVKVVSVYSGQFLDYLFWGGGMIGIDTANRVYTVSGLPSNKFTVTSMADVGTALTRLSILASENPADLAKTVGDERDETIEVKSTSAAETKRKLIDNLADLLSLVRYMLGSV